LGQCGPPLGRSKTSINAEGCITPLGEPTQTLPFANWKRRDCSLGNCPETLERCRTWDKKSIPREQKRLHPFKTALRMTVSGQILRVSFYPSWLNFTGRVSKSTVPRPRAAAIWR
jgi:hypothetical protein